MFIKYLKLENIGVFKGKKEFTFNKGSNLILGQNGHGKSTIIEIMSLLITNIYEGNLESLINNTCDYANSELVFEHNNKEYRNKIELTKKKSVTSKKELYEDDKLVVSGEEVESYLNNILPKELINYSLFAKQRGEKITSVSDSDRREILAQLCELDYSKRIKDIIDPQIDFLKTEINNNEKKEYALENKTYNFGEEKKIENVWTEENNSELVSLERKQKEYEKNKEIQKIISDLNYKVHDLHDDLERKQNEYNIEKLTETHSSELKKLESEHKTNLFNLEEDYKNKECNYERQIRELENEISNVENQISNIKLSKIVKFNEDELIEKRNTYSELITKSKIAFNNAKTLSNGICPTCGGSCNGKHDEFENEGKSLEKQSEEYKTIINDLENKKKEYELKKSENDNNKSLKETLSVKLDSLREKLEMLKFSKEKLYETYDNSVISEESVYTKNCLSCNTLFEEKKNNAKTIIENAHKLYDDTKQELLSIETPSDDVEDCTDKIIELENIKTKYLEDVAYNEAIKENNNKLKKEQKQDKIDLEDVKTKLDELKKSLANYTLSKELMSKTFPNYALDKISDSLVSEINEFIESIYYKELNVKFEPNKNSLKMTYNPNGDRDLPIVKLSGAETQVVDLSVISTFNKRQKLNCLIMDEVDSASSDETAMKFLDALEELTDKYEQTIIITHKKDMQNRLIQKGCNVIKL